jgi:hypothetical protein
VGGLTYADWAVRLHAHFFRPENAGRPITVFVDDDLLAELAPGMDFESAVAHFEAAVQSWVNGGRFPDFSKVYVEGKKWWRRGNNAGACPSLPLLAASVLAASRMTKGEDFAPHNYYIHFAPIVGIHQWRADQATRTRLQSHYGDVIPELWKDLASWLDEAMGGQLGASTITGDDWFTRIGFALSQSLFRQSDRDRLPVFLKKQGLEPHAKVNADEILPYFKRWAMTAPLSPGAKRMVASAAYDRQLGAILTQAAAAWDGSERDDEGRRMARLFTVLEFTPRGRLSLFAERPSGFPLTEEFLADGGTALHLSSSGGTWYDETPIPLPPDGLSAPWRLVSQNRFSLAFTPAPVTPLRQDGALGRWVAASRIELGAPHHIIVRTDLLPRVKDVIRRAGGETPEATAALVDLPHGYSLLRDVVLMRMPSGSLPDELAVLLPVSTQRPLLVGGLRLDLGPNSYLRGGEPDLVVPEEAAAVANTVTVGGHLLSVPSTGTQVTLAGLELHEGSHEVLHGQTRLTFFTCDTLGRDVPAEAGTIGLRLRRTGSSWASSGDPASLRQPISDDSIVITGASVSGPAGLMPRTSPPPIIAPRGRRTYYLIGRIVGDVICLHQPRVPTWLDRIPLYPSGFECYPPFEVGWLLMEGAIGWEARQVNPGGVLTHVHRTRPDVRRWCLPLIEGGKARVRGAFSDWLSFAAAARDEAY